MSEFFSGSRPDLISMKSINDITRVNNTGNEGIDSIMMPVQNQSQNNLNQSKIPFNIKTFFMNYVKPNLLPIFIILLFVGFLVFRYFSKDENVKSNEVQQTKQNNQPAKEYFNPSLPITHQTDKMNYPTAGFHPPKYPKNPELEHSINDVFEKMRKKKQKQYDDVPDIPECEVEHPEDRESVYIGNTSWLGQADGDRNAVYNENNLVTTTADFVQFGLNKNQESIKYSFDDLAKQMFN